MINLTKFAGRTAYNVKEYTVDTESDIADLPTDIAPGSTAFVISTSATYMLNSNGSWNQVVISSGSSSAADVHVANGYLNDDLDLILAFNTDSTEPLTINLGSITDLIDNLETEIEDNKGTELTSDYVNNSFE